MAERARSSRGRSLDAPGPDRREHLDDAAPSVAATAGDAREPTAAPGGAPLVHAGRLAWALLGIAGVFVLAWLVAVRLAVVVVPLLLALFPAALLAPAVALLHRHRVPRPLATALVIVVAAGVVAGVFGLIVPAFLAQVPALAASLSDAGTQLDGLIEQLPGLPPGATLGGLIEKGALAFLGGINAALLAALNLLLGLGLVLVVLVCYLSGGHRMRETGIALLPVRHRASARELVGRLWSTLGAYIRALSLVALFDASAVALGLWLLDVPLVLPLAVLVYFGAFIPYIGAFLSGLAAVLVAFADAGPGTAIAVLGLIIVVQQVDGNLVQPLVMGRATRLSAFTVIVTVTVGAALLGVLGAFIAVPTAACVAQGIAYARERASMPPGPGGA